MHSVGLPPGGTAITPSHGDRGNARLRAMDRYAGIPAVRLLGLRRKRKHLPPPCSLGLLQTAAIGDTVLMSAILPDLRRQFPTARITLFAGPSNYPMARLLIGADDTIRLPLSRPFEAVRLLRRSRLDVLCDFGPWPRLNAILAALSGARFLIGFRTPGEYRHYAYDRSVEHSSRVHEVENQRALVRALGVESTSPPSLQATAPLPESLSPKTYIVFHAWPAGYRKHLKEWPVSYWLDLAEKIHRLASTIVLTGGPADRSAAEELRSELTVRVPVQVENVAGTTSLPETIRVLAEAMAVISVNTGIVHLAAAVGTPVVSLNGPTNGGRWGPVGPKALSVDAPIHGCGYLNLGFEYKGHREDCMAAIRPERVFQALTTLLDPAPPRSPRAALALD